MLVPGAEEMVLDVYRNRSSKGKLNRHLSECNLQHCFCGLHRCTAVLPRYRIGIDVNAHSFSFHLCVCAAFSLDISRKFSRIVRLVLVLTGIRLWDQYVSAISFFRVLSRVSFRISRKTLSPLCELSWGASSELLRFTEAAIAVIFFFLFHVLLPVAQQGKGGGKAADADMPIQTLGEAMSRFAEGWEDGYKVMLTRRKVHVVISAVYNRGPCTTHPGIRDWPTLRHAEFHGTTLGC